MKSDPHVCKLDCIFFELARFFLTDNLNNTLNILNLH